MKPNRRIKKRKLPMTTSARSCAVLWLFVLPVLTLPCTAVLDAGKPAPSACFVRVIDGTFDESAAAVQQTPDGGYIVFGSTQTYGTDKGLGSESLYLIHLDAQGVQDWSQE